MRQDTVTGTKEMEVERLGIEEYERDWCAQSCRRSNEVESEDKGDLSHIVGRRYLKTLYPNFIDNIYQFK